MAYVGTSTTSLSKLMKDYYETLFLATAENNMVSEQVCQDKPLPKNQGRTIRFQRYMNLNVSTTPLTEGVLPTAVELSSEDVTATVQEYGKWTRISKLVSTTAIDPEIKGAVGRFAYDAARTKDRLILTAMGVGGTEQVAGSATAVSELTNISDYVLTSTELRKAIKTLRVNNAMQKEGFYVGLIGPEAQYDLEGDSDFVEAARYEGSTRLFKGEIGRWQGIRFLPSTEVYTQITAGTADWTNGGVFTTHIVGMESVGMVPLEGSDIEIKVKKTNDNDTSQPLERYHTVGWQGTFTQVVLNPNWIVNIKTRATGETSG
jgi:N4-gp56 family major capsid protein